MDLASAFGGPFIREVQIGEFAEALHGGTVVGPRRVDLAVAEAEPDVFARDDNFRKPFLVSLSVSDALVLRDGGDAFGSVTRVFAGRAGAEISRVLSILLRLVWSTTSPSRGCAISRCM